MERRHPGKFEGCESEAVGRLLHSISMEGGDDELGDVETFGWFGLITQTGIPSTPHAIVEEDDRGFFVYTTYQTEEAAREAWAELEAEYLAWLDENDLEGIPF